MKTNGTLCKEALWRPQCRIQSQPALKANLDQGAEEHYFQNRSCSDVILPAGQDRRQVTISLSWSEAAVARGMTRLTLVHRRPRFLRNIATMLDDGVCHSIDVLYVGITRAGLETFLSRLVEERLGGAFRLILVVSGPMQPEMEQPKLA